MWEVLESDEYLRRRKRLEKDHARELRYVLGNFAAFVTALNEGTPPKDFRTSFVHREAAGFLAITEKGAGKNAVPIRLYLYPDDENERLYVVTLGTKKTQQDDNQFCKNSLPFILGEGRSRHVQEEGL